MSNWDDDFWSDQEAEEIKAVSEPVPDPRTEYVNLEELGSDANPPDLPSIELPSPISDIPHSAALNLFVDNAKSVSSLESRITDHRVLSPDDTLSEGWGWGSFAAKVTSSAADLILMPEDGQQGQQASLQLSESQQLSPNRNRTRSGSRSKWFESLGSVLENVKASAGQSGRELIQVATEALVKKPGVLSNSSADAPVSSPQTSFRTEQDFFELFQDHHTQAQSTKIPSNSVQVQSFDSQSSQMHSPHTGQILPHVLSHSVSRSSSPAAFHPSAPGTLHQIPHIPMDSASWNDEWEADEKHPPSNKSFHSSYSNRLSPVLSPSSTRNENVSTGWLQDVFEGVRITAAQSGQELLQASGVLTSEVLDKAKSIVPNISVPQESVFNDLPGRKPVSLSPPSSPHTLNEMFSSAQMLSASDRESPEEGDDSEVEIFHQEEMTLRPSQHPEDVEHHPCAEMTQFFASYPRLPDSEEECSSADFDALFNLYGGAEVADQLEQIGRERSIYLERNVALYDSSLLDTVDEIGTIIRQGESKQAISCSMVSNIEKLIGEVLNWHVVVLKVYAQNNPQPDMFALFDQIQVYCRRTAAILAARTIHFLLHSVQQLNVDSKSALGFASVLRRFLIIFQQKSKLIISSSIEIARQICSSSDEYDEDITVLCADIEVDVFEARFRVEDAVGNVVPLLQCMALPQ